MEIRIKAAYLWCRSKSRKSLRIRKTGLRGWFLTENLYLPLPATGTHLILCFHSIVFPILFVGTNNLFVARIWTDKSWTSYYYCVQECCEGQEEVPVYGIPAADRLRPWLVEQAAVDSVILQSRPGLWICIQLFFFQCGSGSSYFFNKDPDQLQQICKKFPYESFSIIEKDNKDCSTVKKKTMELVQIYKINVIKLQLLPVPISLQFVCFFLLKFFPPGSIRIRIHSPGHDQRQNFMLNLLVVI